MDMLITIATYLLGLVAFIFTLVLVAWIVIARFAFKSYVERERNIAEIRARHESNRPTKHEINL